VKGAKIKYVLLTQFHEDFVGGHQELAAATGAKIILGAGAKANAKLKALVAKDREVL